MEWTYFFAGGVGIEDGAAYASLEGKDRAGMNGRRGIGGCFSLWTNVVVDDDGDAAAEVLEVDACRRIWHAKSAMINEHGICSCGGG